MKTLTTTQILDYTNARLNGWYNEATEYGVNGAAIAFIHNGKIVIDYSENGVNARFTLNHFEGEAIDYVFNVWCEDANIEADKVDKLITFKDCDEYASFVQDSLLDFGDRVTEEFNSYSGLSLPIGANVYEIKDLPNTGKNYDQFGTVKAWLYDLYELHKENDLTTIEIF